ncbi:uncharacterized protein PGTG_20770 [Puccinia graminis f. sp. tritici CRL 75-36-700-3]|uniref:Uncharacterized protein n=1 Tax=Puccinia graminis f. sp. tritici (strain CRL 75-36-700-3 / race SCCL) TaxID=418459 RepID=H6QP58_PUCGT|nr:uncharacterized protein PGTG_20770 [Puccinia graminis f. sp. tritici CRL 75-36-700-3]EHS63188.1 hypothetical protein PGTG_20770 [Puccinia graminis f. sp. tritici CRL 75-36-700-3]
MRKNICILGFPPIFVSDRFCAWDFLSMRCLFAGHMSTHTKLVQPDAGKALCDRVGAPDVRLVGRICATIAPTALSNSD